MSRGPGQSLKRRARDFAKDTRGAAAAEIVFWLAILTLPVLAGLDIGIYVYKRMQIDTAAEQAVHAVRRACGFNQVPVTDTSKCAQATMTGAITTAIQGTSLGTDVTLASGYPIEGYYCVNGSNALTLVGTAGTTGTAPAGPSPMTCNSVTTGSAAAPGDYIQVKVNYTYTPVFSGGWLSGLLTSPITRTAWLRVG